MQYGVVQFPRQRQRPEPVALGPNTLGVLRRRTVRPANLEESRAQLPVNLQADVFVGNPVLAELPRQRRQSDAFPRWRPVTFHRKLRCPLCYRILET